jgi:hypothetical protein
MAKHQLQNISFHFYEHALYKTPEEHDRSTLKQAGTTPGRVITLTCTIKDAKTSIGPRRVLFH